MNADELRPIRCFLLLVLLLVSTPAVFAAEVCGPSPAPGATLLIPYFEVDLDDPAGRTTLISVSNADSQPVVARVTLWTNMAAPSLLFDLVLGADAVQTMDLRTVLAGDVPGAAANETFSRCDGSFDYDLPAHLVPALQAMHRGESPFGNNQCFGLPADEPGLAVGYVTVDAMNDCNPAFAYPGDGEETFGHHYFEHGGGGLASNRNVLFGDVFYVDPGNDAAMGIAALSLRADAERFAPFDRTFYYGLGTGGDDSREPMPSTYRTRFFDGGAFDGESDVILWLDPGSSFVEPAGFACDDPSFLVDNCQFLTVRVFDESGDLQSEQVVNSFQPLSRRLRVGGEALPVPVDFGFVEIRNQILEACILLPTGFEPLQASAVTVLRAEGRFSAALESVALDSLCEPSPP